MQMFNADGSEGQMCGNGIRCFVRFGIDNFALNSTSSSFEIETASGILSVRPSWDDGVMTGASVSMGDPILKPSLVPVAAPDDLKIALDYPLDVDGSRILVNCVSMGNPHAVVFMDAPVDDYELTRIGPMVEHHPFFSRACELRDRKRLGARPDQGARLGARFWHNACLRHRRLRRGGCRQTA